MKLGIHFYDLIHKNPVTGEKSVHQSQRLGQHKLSKFQNYDSNTIVGLYKFKKFYSSIKRDSVEAQ